jgi:ATP-dependent DNA helicase RecG
MTVEQLKIIISEGEGTQVEFKKSSFQLSKDIFESICAFLNRNGGHLLLGVTDSGQIEGVIEGSIKEIIDSLVTGCNNIQKLNPTFYLSTEVIEVDRKKIIYVYVPESSQVHNTNGKVFDRNSDGDFDITNNPALVSQLYLRKQSTFSENTIYPYLSTDDFEPELFDKIRILARNQRANHPWQEMSHEELLKSSSLWRKDLQSGQEGYTLASAVLLGKDETIFNILPHYRTDAIVRIDNLDRYDDRDDIRCNLFKAYFRLNDFIGKHLPDKFYVEGTQRISIRDKIFREIVANLLIHREFTNHFPAKLIIERDQVLTENGNKPHGVGRIDPGNFSPYPKNPTIARFFKEIGWAEELGSGIRNAVKYCNNYNGNRGNAEFIEADIFRTIIPLPLFISQEATLETKMTLTVTDTTIYDVKDMVDDAINEAVSDAVTDAIKDAVKDTVSDVVIARLTNELIYIVKNRGISLNSIRNNFKIERATAQRDMKILKDIEFVKFEGAPRIGKYVATEKAKKIKLKKKDQQ